MSVTETKVFFFGIQGDESLREGCFSALVGFHHPTWIAVHGEGWIPVSHALTPLTDGTYSLSVMASREVSLDELEAAFDERN